VPAQSPLLLNGLHVDDAPEHAAGAPVLQQRPGLGLVDALEAEDLAGIEDARVIELRPTFFEQFAAGPGFDLRTLFGGSLPSTELVLIREIINGYNVPRYMP
jgi:hypothetical protein